MLSLKTNNFGMISDTIATSDSIAPRDTIAKHFNQILNPLKFSSKDN